MGIGISSAFFAPISDHKERSYMKCNKSYWLPYSVIGPKTFRRNDRLTLFLLRLSSSAGRASLSESASSVSLGQSPKRNPNRKDGTKNFLNHNISMLM